MSILSTIIKKIRSYFSRKEITWKYTYPKITDETQYMIDRMYKALGISAITPSKKDWPYLGCGAAMANRKPCHACLGSGIKLYLPSYSAHTCDICGGTGVLFTNEKV